MSHMRYGWDRSHFNWANNHESFLRIDPSERSLGYSTAAGATASRVVGQWFASVTSDLYEKRANRWAGMMKYANLYEE